MHDRIQMFEKFDRLYIFLAPILIGDPLPIARGHNPDRASRRQHPRAIHRHASDQTKIGHWRSENWRLHDVQN